MGDSVTTIPSNSGLHLMQGQGAERPLVGTSTTEVYFPCLPEANTPDATVHVLCRSNGKVINVSPSDVENVVSLIVNAPAAASSTTNPPPLVLFKVKTRVPESFSVFPQVGVTGGSAAATEAPTPMTTATAARRKGPATPTSGMTPQSSGASAWSLSDPLSADDPLGAVLRACGHIKIALRAPKCTTTAASGSIRDGTPRASSVSPSVGNASPQSSAARNSPVAAERFIVDYVAVCGAALQEEVLAQLRVAMTACQLDAFAAGSSASLPSVVGGRSQTTATANSSTLPSGSSSGLTARVKACKGTVVEAMRRLQKHPHCVAGSVSLTGRFDCADSLADVLTGRAAPTTLSENLALLLRGTPLSFAAHPPVSACGEGCPALNPAARPVSLLNRSDRGSPTGQEGPSSSGVPAAARPPLAPLSPTVVPTAMNGAPANSHVAEHRAHSAPAPSTTESTPHVSKAPSKTSPALLVVTGGYTLPLPAVLVLMILVFLCTHTWRLLSASTPDANAAAGGSTSTSNAIATVVSAASPSLGDVNITP